MKKDNNLSQELEKEEQEYLKRKACVEKLNSSNNVEELTKLNDKLNQEIAKKGLKTLNYKQVKNKAKKGDSNGN